MLLVLYAYMFDAPTMKKVDTTHHSRYHLKFKNQTESIYCWNKEGV